jgi:hypothetical protein
MEVRTLGVKDYDALMALWRRSGLSSLRPQGRDSREAFARQLASGVQSEDRGIPMSESNDAQWRISASEFLDSLFREELADQTKYDPEVVRLIKQHLGTGSLHSRAGVRLAEALVQLAKARATENDQ